jgi:radical SAM superfamily enzyme YgiQ (UPF0313 family)
MKILLVYPETPNTFWSFKNALKFISKASSEPPLGLLTVAALLPKNWQQKLVDLNVSPLKDRDIIWADYVFLSGMNLHLMSMKNIIGRVKKLNKPIVVGGPLCTMNPTEFQNVDHLILNEAEITLPLFLEDLKMGKTKPVYSSSEYPDISLVPIPRWDLLMQKKYATMNIQYSRGCPYDCDFCSITTLNGRKPRAKSTPQFLAELDSLYNFGWKGNVFIVDDNFIGNKQKLKKEMLPALIQWSKTKHYPFSFITEVSINLADDEELVNLMVQAGFVTTFVGIETPNKTSLKECGKTINFNRDLIKSVRKLQSNGLIVSGGFIVGFDNDPPTIFDDQIHFIQKSGIVTAMVGLLNAPSGTRLYQRLKTEKRLLNIFSGDNMDGSINFIPKMKYGELMRGYKRILSTIYSQKEYYERMITFIKQYHLPVNKSVKVSFSEILALLKSFWILGVLEKGNRFYWKILIYSLLRYPRKLPLVVRMAIYGFHFRKVVETI